MDKYKLATFICIIWIAISNWGCFQYYYLTNSRKSINDSSLLALQAQDKHFIIYLANGNYFLTNLKVNDSLLNADVTPLSDFMSRFLYPKDISNRYKTGDADIVLNQVQLYAQTQNLIDSARLSIPLHSISRVDIFTKDNGRTTANHIISGIGAAAVIGFGVLCIIVAQNPL